MSAKGALHVDRIREQPGWNRPSDVITKADADYWAGAAVVRYDLLRRDLERDATEIGKRIWAGIQHLPEPTWDVWTWEEEPNP